MRRFVFPLTAISVVIGVVACGSRTGFDLEEAGGISSENDAATPFDSGSPDSKVRDSDVRDSSVTVDTSLDCSITQGRVFLTSTMYDGDLGGVRGADAQCMARANAAGLGGAWRAWLSDSITPASAHIADAPGGYFLLDGTFVAAGLAALESGDLSHAIDLTEMS